MRCIVFLKWNEKCDLCNIVIEYRKRVIFQWKVTILNADISSNPFIIAYYSHKWMLIVGFFLKEKHRLLLTWTKESENKDISETRRNWWTFMGARNEPFFMSVGSVKSC